MLTGFIHAQNLKDYAWDFIPPFPVLPRNTLETISLFSLF